MTETVTVASRAHTAILIQEPLLEEFKDKPGDAPALKTAVLNGSTHESAKGGAGITRNVDAALFRVWHETQTKAHSLVAGLVSIVSPEDEKKSVSAEYGFEPGLERLKADSENTEAAAKGSTVETEGAVSSIDMAATSDTPNDDTPRGDPDVARQVVHTQEPATDRVQELGEDAPHAGSAG